MLNFQGLVGLAAILALSWILSEDRSKRPPWLWIAGAIAVPIVIALIVTRSELAQQLIRFANDAVTSIERATLVGSSYMFGYTGGAPIPFVQKPGVQEPVIVAFQILPLIIVFSALSALLWHWGILKAIVRALSWALRRGLGVSGFVGLGGASTLFLGVVESPLVLKAWLSRVSRSLPRMVDHVTILARSWLPMPPLFPASPDAIGPVRLLFLRPLLLPGSWFERWKIRYRTD